MIVQEFKLYDNRDDVTLTTYVIAEKGELQAVGKRPAVLICPGGGYFGCSDREAEPVALAFAAMGYHAFVLRYSTWMEGKTEYPDIENIEIKPRISHPAPVREIGMAFLLIRRHSAQWQVDMERIAVCGFSAGAHNAAMYGVYWNKPLITDALSVQAEEIRPAALILSYPVTDFLDLEEKMGQMSDQDRKFYQAIITSFLGKSVYQTDELYAVSPARLVDEQMPPTFLWATTTDELVPVRHSLRLASALADHGIPFEQHLYEGGVHGLSLATQASATEQMFLNEHASEWIEEVRIWLKKRFAVPIPYLER